MHNALLADFSRCLHVRKRTYSPPSDLGNRTKPSQHAIRATQQATQLLDGWLGGSAQRRKPFFSTPYLLRIIVIPRDAVEKVELVSYVKKTKPPETPTGP